MPWALLLSDLPIPGPVSIWLTAVLQLLALQVLRLLVERLRLSPLPWRTLTLAVLAAALGLTFNWEGINPLLRSLVAVADDLLLALAGVRLALWTLLELPSGLPGWPRTPKILRDLIWLCLGALITVVLLQQRARFDLLGLVTTSAVLTAVLGLAAQAPLRDLVAGITLESEDALRIGEWVSLGDEIGQVIGISWRFTSIRTIEAARLMLTNTEVCTRRLINYSRLGPHANRFFLTVPAEMGPEETAALLRDGLNDHPLVLLDPAPVIRIAEYRDGWAHFEVIAWHHDFPQRLNIRHALQCHLWYALHRRGLSLDLPPQQLRWLRYDKDSQQSVLQHAPRGEREFLRRLPLFAEQPEPIFEALLQASRPLVFGPGETLLREGSYGKCLYVLVKGVLQVEQQVAGNTRVLAQLHAGDLCGEMGVLSGQQSCATVRSIEECELIAIDGDAMELPMRQHPPLREALERLAAARRATNKAEPRPTRTAWRLWS